MTLPNPIPSPISGGARWSMASAANIAHLEHGAKVANEAPVPKPVTEALAATSADHWGQLGDLASAIAINLPLQILEAAWHYPLGAVAVIWWVWETLNLIRALQTGLRNLRDRRVRKRKSATEKRGTQKRRRPSRGRRQLSSTRKRGARASHKRMSKRAEPKVPVNDNEDNPQ